MRTFLFTNFLFLISLCFGQNSIELIGKLDPIYPTTSVNANYFGSHVIVLGDINGDGFEDWSANGSNNKYSVYLGNAVYIYLGSDSMKNNQEPNLTIASQDQPRIYSRSKVNNILSAGDFNNDGYADFVVVYNSYAALYLGKENIGTKPDIIIDKENINVSNFNFSFAGDVNNDGFDDLMIINTPKLLFVFGNNKSEIKVNCDITIDEKQFFTNVRSKSIGDINKDGYDDFAATVNAKILIYLGGETISTVPSQIFESEVAHVYDADVQGNFDYNNDGYYDFMYRGGTRYGDLSYVLEYYVFSGKNFPSPYCDHIISIPTDLTQNLRVVKDLDGDNFDDFVFTDHLNRFVIISVKEGLKYSAKSIIPYTQVINGFSDFNNDGNIDLLVADPLNNDFGKSSGMVGVIFNTNQDTLKPDLSFHGLCTDAYFGNSVTGDFNNDNINDILISNTNYLSTKYLLYLGGKDYGPLPDMEISFDNESPPIKQFDMSGDVNDDGFDDIIFANYSENCVDIILGNTILNNQIDYTIRNSASYFGSSVSINGDFNGDGFDDILVGACLDASNNIYPGKAFLYYGGTTLDTIPDITFSGEIDGEQFGTKVQFVGDLNNDGFDDIAIGAYNSGIVYVFYGNKSDENNPDLILESESPLFNNAISSAGDLNNDGFDDLIYIGSPYRSDSNDQFNDIYIFYGGEKMIPKPDLIIQNRINGLGLAYHVNGSSDLNNDGYNDLLVHVGGKNLFVYFGSKQMDNKLDYIINNSENSNSNVYSYSLLGDTNKDNNQELLVTYFNSERNGQCFIYSLEFNKKISKIENIGNVYVSRFDNSRMISYFLHQDLHVEIELYNINGNYINTLHRNDETAGEHWILWSSKDLQSGVYIILVKTENDARACRILVKN